MKAHVWVGPKGEDWTPDAASDNCHKCGSTPDNHPLRPTDWALRESRAILDWLHVLDWMPYHTMKRREKDLARRLMEIAAGHLGEHEHRWVNPDSGDGTPMFNDPICSICGIHPE